METYDIIMLVVVLAAGIFGAMKGFAWQIAAIAAMSVSYGVAMKFREPFSQQIQAEPPWNMFLAMFILFVGTMVSIWILFRMLSRTIDRLQLREFDSLAGGLFGLAKGVLYCVLITMFAVSLAGDSVRTKIVESKSGYYIAKLLDYSDNIIPEEMHQVVGPYLDRLDEKLRAGETSGSEQSGLISWPTSGNSEGSRDNSWNQNLPAPVGTENLNPANFLPADFFERPQQQTPAPARR